MPNRELQLNLSVAILPFCVVQGTRLTVAGDSPGRASRRNYFRSPWLLLRPNHVGDRSGKGEGSRLPKGGSPRPPKVASFFASIVTWLTVPQDSLTLEVKPF